MANGSVVKGTPLMYVPNLLINGDFMINQRGQNSYSRDSSGFKYTLDMWMLRTGQVSIVNGGITLNKIDGYSGCTLGQYLDNNIVGKTLTMIVKIEGQVYSKTITNIQSDVNEFYYVTPDVLGFGISVKEDKYMFQLVNTTETPAMFEYVDLFEGSVAYPHVQEDHATALSRCLKWLQVLKTSGGIYYEYSHGNSEYSYCVLCSFDTMICNPIVDVIYIGYYDDKGFVRATVEKVNVDGNSRCAIYTNKASRVRERISQFNIEITLSCEPL